MDKNIFESLDEIFWDIKHRTLLVLEHSHSPNLIHDVLSEEFPKDSPHEGYCLESLLKFEFDCYKVFLSSKKGACMQLLLIMS